MDDIDRKSTSDDAPRPTARLLVRDLGDEILILDTVADQIHQLNVSASMIWRLSESGFEEPDIAAALANKFDISQDQAERDTAATLSAFRNLKLLARSLS